MKFRPLSFGSLFAGIGGLDLGLERAGLRCRWQVEIDAYARRVLKKHWPDVPKHDDVRTFPPSEGDWHVDVIAGGFPCQDISYAGKGAGLGGERSGLWREAARVVRTLRPRYVLLENVAALLTRGLDSVLGTLASFGYDAEWHCLPAAHVGAPHIRDRIFVLGYAERVGRDAGRIGDAGDDRQVVAPAAEDAGPLADPSGDRPRLGLDPRGLVVGYRPDGVPGERVEGPGGPGDGRQPGGVGLDLFRETIGRAQWGRDPADDPESGVGRMAHGVPDRVDRLRGLGNAVVPQIAEFIGRRLIEFDQAVSDGR